MAGAMRLATVGVSDLDASLKLYRDTLGFVEERRYPLSPSLAAAWALPPGTAATLIELSANHYPIGRLRLAAFTPAATQKVRSDMKGGPDTPLDVGPKALDFYVRDPIQPAIDKLVAAGCVARSAPIKHQIADTVSEELVLTGPDDVPILIMVGHVHGPNSLRSGSPEGQFSEVPTISIVADDLERSRLFWGELLGLTAVTDAETPEQYRDLVSTLTGTPPGSRIHFLLYAAPGEASGKILLVHFFDRTAKRLTGRMRPGALGFSLLTHDCDDLDDVGRRLAAAGFAPLAPASEVEMGDERRRVLLVKGPNEEMVELVETR